jgi:hypothetical protein
MGRLSSSVTSQNSVTVNVIGELNKGDITMPVSYTSTGNAADDGWNLLGNPYASAYDWNTFWNAGNTGNSGTHYANISPVISVLDASSNSYRSYNALSNTGTFNGIIASGQCFFAKATATSPSMTFKEQYKSTGTPTQLFKTEIMDELHIRMEYDSITYDDFILKNMTPATSLHDAYDIKKMTNAECNISSYGTDTIYHTVDVRTLKGTDTIPLYIRGINASFTFKFRKLPTLPSGWQFFWEDQYLSTRTAVTANLEYTFSIQSSTPASFGANRFRLIMDTVSPTLPVTLISFHAQKKSASNALLTWTTSAEINNDHFIVERSEDGKAFEEIGIIASQNKGSGITNYLFEDHIYALQQIPIIYYRLKQVDKSGSFTLSRIVSIQNTLIGNDIVVYPNPTKDVLHIDLSSGYTNSYKIEIMDMSGNKIMEHISNRSKAELTISDLKTGIYMVRVIDILSGEQLLITRLMKDYF